MHAALKPLEARPGVGGVRIIERDDLAVEHRLVHTERRHQPAYLGVAGGDVVEVPALEAQAAWLNVGDRADAVPLDLERPLARIPRKLAGGPGHHRDQPLGHRLAVRIRGRIHPVDHPVVLRVPGLADREQSVASGQPLAVKGHLDLALLPLVDVERALVPDRHRAGAVLTLRDLAVELEVLERVVLGAHREPVVRWIRRNAVGDRPRREHAVVLEPQIPVQAGGVVLLDDEPVPVAVAGVDAGGLRRGVEVALGAVARKLILVLGPWHPQ